MPKALGGHGWYVGGTTRAKICAFLCLVSVIYLLEQAKLYRSRPIGTKQEKHFETHAVSCKPLKLGTFHFQSAEFLLNEPIIVEDAISSWNCLEQCIQRNTTHVAFATASVLSLSERLSIATCYCGNSVKILDLTDRVLAFSENETNFSSVVKLFYITSTCRKDRQITENDIRTHFLGFYFGNLLVNPNYTKTLKHYKPETCYAFCERNSFHIAVINTNLCTCLSSRKRLKDLIRLDDEYFDKTNKRHFAIWITWASDDFCHKKSFLPNDSENECVGLISFAGSGNTFLRSMLESATGIYTGSVYTDIDVYNKGMLGEMMSGCNRTLCVKDHIYSDKSNTLKDYTKIVLLIRNPFDALMAEFNRRTSQNHVGLAQPNLYYTREWSKFVIPMTNQWKNSIIQVLNSRVVKHIVYYQDLIDYPEREIRKILTFLRRESRTPFWSRDFKTSSDRLACLATEDFGLFKRKSRAEKIRPFTSAVVNFVNIAIKKVRKELALNLCPSCKVLPPYLAESKNAQAGIYISRLVKSRGKLMGQVITF